MNVRHGLRRSVAIVWLAIVWVMLWGTWSVANAIVGLFVGTLLLKFFALPDVRFRAQPSLKGMVIWVATVFSELVLASIQVAVQAMHPHATRQSAIVAVQLRSKSELVHALLIESVTLVPGSMVLEFERSERMVYAHIWGVATPEEVERAKVHILKLEQRVVHAIGDRRGQP